MNTTYATSPTPLHPLARQDHYTVPVITPKPLVANADVVFLLANFVSTPGIPVIRASTDYLEGVEGASRIHLRCHGPHDGTPAGRELEQRPDAAGDSVGVIHKRPDAALRTL